MTVLPSEIDVRRDYTVSGAAAARSLEDVERAVAARLEEAQAHSKSQAATHSMARPLFKACHGLLENLVIARTVYPG